MSGLTFIPKPGAKLKAREKLFLALLLGVAFCGCASAPVRPAINVFQRCIAACYPYKPEVAAETATDWSCVCKKRALGDPEEARWMPPNNPPPRCLRLTPWEMWRPRIWRRSA